MDIGREFAYKHAAPQRGAVDGGRLNLMAKKLKKSKKIAAKKSMKIMLKV